MATSRIVLPVALGSYVNIFTPRPPPEGQSGEPKYSISLLFDKANKKELEPLQKLIEHVATEKFGPTAKELLAKGKLRNPIRDGDEDRPEDEVYAGKLFVGASTTRQPGIVDAKLQPVFEESEAYSGCFFRCSVAVFAYDKAGNKGVSLGLNNIQVVKKGTRIDGRVAAEKEFAEFGDASPAPAKGKASKQVDISDID
jgi:hypothetical protein